MHAIKTAIFDCNYISEIKFILFNRFLLVKNEMKLIEIVPKVDILVIEFILFNYNKVIRSSGLRKFRPTT